MQSSQESNFFNRVTIADRLTVSAVYIRSSWSVVRLQLNPTELEFLKLLSLSRNLTRDHCPFAKGPFVQRTDPSQTNIGSNRIASCPISHVDTGLYRSSLLCTHQNANSVRCVTDTMAEGH
jgi:hypothetical protein